MLAPYSPGKYFEKILTNAEGQQFRVLFLVALVNGELKAQIISAEPLTQPLATKTQEVACLPVYKEKQSHSYTYTPSFAPILSPLNDFFFFMSQPPRAPSFSY